MSELQLMVLVVAVIYLWECGVWLRRGAVAFRMDARGRWRLHHPATALGNPAGGLVLAPPLPPFPTAGTFRLTLEFSEEYPNRAPTVRFQSTMFHPNSSRWFGGSRGPLAGRGGVVGGPCQPEPNRNPFPPPNPRPGPPTRP